MSQMLQIEKPDYNDEARIFQWRRPDGKGQLNSDETLTSCEVVCTERTSGKSVDGMVSDVGVYDQTQCRYRLKGGDAGKQYILKFHAMTSNGQKLEDRALLMVT